MIKKLSDNISDHIMNNKFKYLALIASLFGGLVFGIILCLKGNVSENYAENFISSYKLYGVSSKTVFISSFLSYMRCGLILWVSGRHIFLTPLVFVQVFSKAFGLGYTISYFVSVLGFNGVLLSFSSMFLQNIIFIPLMLIYSVWRINFALKYRESKSSPASFKQKERLNLEDFKIFMLFFALILACVLIEAYIIPSLYNPICTKF